MSVECRLFARTDIERLGIAPFSSMFWYGEATRKQAADWRPEIHDSDGLSVLTGSGERIWRPINNPPKVITSAFIDKDVQGFGLLQRDRDFVHYLDDGVFYERRPSVWVEPLDAWALPLLNTLILLTSGTTVTWAHHAVQHGNQRGLVNGLILTVVLGALFTTFQAIEYAEALNNGMFKFTGGGIYGSSFFMATGFHGLHVLIGTIFLIVCLLRALAGQFTPTRHFGFEAAAWYWHFVDVVWLFLFAFIYVLGNQGLLS